ncbi:MAG: SGNH/GDSL hydrolase family protein [Vicinamibacterales bacterium]
MAVLSRRRKLWFAAVAVGTVAMLTVLAFLAADVYVHQRTQDIAGVNVWGYRGAPRGAKRPGEHRVVMIGGSTVFGWGLPVHESIPAYLERRLNAAAADRSPRFSVINLGAPGEGAYGFAYELADYAYLDYDLVCFYEGYNDLGPFTIRGRDNYLLWRRESPVFRLTGYYPILPLVLREKATAMLQGGSISADPSRVTFTPGLATRATAGAFRAAAQITNRLGGQVGGLSPVPPNPPVVEECGGLWKHYCGSVRAAVAWALARDKRVMFVTQPYISDAHIDQQANVAAMLRAAFGREPRFRYVNLGGVVDMTNRDLAYDGLHLIASGNDTVASHLVDPVMELVRQK